MNIYIHAAEKIDRNIDVLTLIAASLILVAMIQAAKASDVGLAKKTIASKQSEFAQAEGLDLEKVYLFDKKWNEDAGRRNAEASWWKQGKAPEILTSFKDQIAAQKAKGLSNLGVQILFDPTRQIPLPGATGTPKGLPGFESWELCKAAGSSIVAESCSLYDDSCVPQKINYKNSCFTQLGGVGSLKLGVTPAAGTVQVAAIKPVLATLEINGKAECSGLLLDAHHYLTAGHCSPVVENCWATQDCVAKVVRAEGGGSVDLVERLTPDYIDVDPSTDFAVWKIDEGLHVNDTPRAHLFLYPPTPLLKTPAVLAGVGNFPCEVASSNCKPTNFLIATAEHTQCGVVCGSQNGVIYHDCQTFPGMSGAPLITSTSSHVYVAGIHSRHDPRFKTEECHNNAQIAIPMAKICSWINESAPHLKEVCNVQAR
jgi:hypothetical protein